MNFIFSRRLQLIFFFFGMTLISGVLQRPVGGQELYGSMAEGIINEGNSILTYVGILFYAWAAWLFVYLWPNALPGSKFNVLIFIVALASSSTFWSVDPSNTFIESLGLIGVTLFSLVVISIFTVDELIDLTAWFFAILFLFIFLIFFLFPNYSTHSSDGVYWMHAGLLRGTYHHKNSLGGVISLGLIFVFFHTLSGRYGRLVGLFSLFAGIYMLLLSGSAKSFVAVPIALMCGYFFSRINGFGFRVLLMCLCVSFLIMSDVIGLLDYLRLIVLDGLDRDVNMSARTFIWDIAIVEGLRDPVLGSGFGGSGWKEGIGLVMRQTLLFDPGHSHNGFIQTFVELGFVGLFLIITHLLIVIYGLLKMDWLAGVGVKIFPALIVVYLLNNYAGSFMIVANDIYWYVIFLISFFLQSLQTCLKSSSVK